MIIKVVPEPVLCRTKDIMGSCGSWITEWALLTEECEGEQKLLLNFFKGGFYANMLKVQHFLLSDIEIIKK